MYICTYLLLSLAAATPIAEAPDPDDGGVGPHTPGRYSVPPSKNSVVVGDPPHANIDLFWFISHQSHLMLLLTICCCCSRPNPKVVITSSVSSGY